MFDADDPSASPRCSLCHSLSNHALSEADREFFHCRRCDLLFVPPAFHLAEDLQRIRYDRHDNSLRNDGYARMLGEVVRVVQRFKAPPARILDFGCGPSQCLIELLTCAGYDATGHDPLYGIEGLSDGPFDAVVSTETFEHLSRPGDELRRIRDALKPGGILVLTTLLHLGASQWKGWWYLRDQTHVSFYSERTLRWIADAIRFVIEEFDGRRRIVMRRTA